MSAGDVLLFHRPTSLSSLRSDPMGTVMTALIHLTTRSKWNHAALDIGDGLMVEATAAGVAVNPIASADEIETATPWYLGNDLEEVLAWSTARVGVRYGYVNAFFCGLRNLFPGWSVVQDKAFICSQLVAEATERAGHDYGKSTEKVSPGDLAEHFGIPRQ
jgi:uncharacterized protein YycO